MLAFLRGAGHSRRRDGDRQRLPAHHRDRRCLRRSLRRAGRQKPGQRHGAVSRHGGAADHHRAGAAGVRSRRRSRYASARICRRIRRWRRWSRRGRACACPAHGTVSNSRCAPSSASRSRCRRRRNCSAGWWNCMACALPEEMRGIDGLTHVFPSPARLAGIDLGLGMPRARAQAVTSLASGACRRSRDLQPGRQPRSGDRKAARAAGDRRMDRAIHRDARVARARCVSGRRYRLDARHG